MAQLIVRNLEERIAKRLKEQAAAHGVSAEEEHRRILKAALAPDNSFKDLLRAIPDVGDDEDFARMPQPPRDVEL